MKPTLAKVFFFCILLCVSSIECSLQSFDVRQSSSDINEKELKPGMLTWTCPFKDSTKIYNESDIWENFLHNMYCKFSEYEVQASKRNYRVRNTVFGKQSCNVDEIIHTVQKEKVNKNNIKRFFNKIAKCNFTQYHNFRNITSIQIEELNYILNLTLRDALHVNCEGANVYIKGNYITTSDIVDVLILKGKVTDSKCKNLLLNDKKKYINIFPLNTVFIDTNINSSLINTRKIGQLSIIAPKWENIGRNIIELKGKDAELPAMAYGIDGKPGKPGGPGGNFFGIGSEFINGNKLEISVNGGDGSRGQDGKNGQNGKDGITPIKPPPKLWCKNSYCKDNAKIEDFDCKNVKCHYYKLARVPGYSFTAWCIYEIFGKSGTEGTDGGKGGKGGKGGYPGNIELIELKSQSEVSLLNNAGQDGENGKGGKGGLGGRKGNDITVKCEPPAGFTGDNSWSVESTKMSNEKAKSGQNGEDGGNTIGM